MKYLVELYSIVKDYILVERVRDESEEKMWLWIIKFSTVV